VQEDEQNMDRAGKFTDEEVSSIAQMLLNPSRRHGYPYVPTVLPTVGTPLCPCGIACPAPHLLPASRAFSHGRQPHSPPGVAFDLRLD